MGMTLGRERNINMIKRPIGIIIPTYNNRTQLAQAVTSIINNKVAENLFHIYVINNGHKDSCKFLEDFDEVTVFNSDKNLGWTGGIKKGMEISNEPFLVFMNDDAFVPASDRDWLNLMIQNFKNEKVAAIGPISNVVMGGQNIWSISDNAVPKKLQRYLIFFCVMVRREAVEKVGGIDDSMSGGDDFDLCMRFWNNDYITAIDKRVFIYHHGFQTGNRVHGDSSKKGGWNSYEYKHRVDTELIRKHGLKTFIETIRNILPAEDTFYEELDLRSSEKDILSKYVTGETVYEFGVGGEKTVPNAIGVDIVKVNEVIATLNETSIADITHDLSTPIELEDKADTIIARHILEHLPNPIAIVKNWSEQLKKGGRLIVAVPDNDSFLSIPVNIEHLHAFNKDLLKDLFDVCGLKIIKLDDTGNGVSIYAVGEKS
jgi:GT2 family glycosyltransferase